MATWSKLFSFFTWKNRPDTSTPLGQTLLNRLNTALNGIDDRVITLNAQKASTEEIQGVFTDVRLIKNTGQFVFTLLDGTEKIIDTALEKISINVRFDQATQMMVLEKEDGSIEYVDLSAFTTQYEFASSPTIQQTVTDGKVRADIKPNSITDQMLQTNYLADITTQANTALSASQSSLESQFLAEQSAEEAKEQADRAKAEADRAESVSAVDIATTEKAGIVKPDGTTITVDADGTIHGNASVTVDTELDVESTNPIANKAVAEALENVENVIGVTPQMFGAKGDGVTDDTQAFLYLAFYANGRDYTYISIPEGHYIINGQISFNRNVDIIGSGKGTVLDFSGAEISDVGITVTGSCVLVDGLSGDVTKGDNYISLIDNGTIAQGDIIAICDQNDYSWYSSRAYYRKGELIKVAEINETGLVSCTPLYDSYTADSVLVYKLNTVSGSIKDLTVIGKHVDDTASDGNVIRIIFGENFNVENIVGSNSNSAILSFSRCYDATASNLNFNTSEFPSIGLNYGVVVGNSMYVRVENSYLMAGRHGIATGGGADDVNVVNRGCIYSNNVCVAPNGNYAIDTHENSEDITVCDNFATGICCFGKNHFINNNNIITTGRGVSVLSIDGVTISNNKIKSFLPSTDNNGAISVDIGDVREEKPTINVVGNTVWSESLNIRIQDTSRRCNFVVQNNAVSRKTSNAILCYRSVNTIISENRINGGLLCRDSEYAKISDNFLTTSINSFGLYSYDCDRVSATNNDITGECSIASIRIDSTDTLVLKDNNVYGCGESTSSGSDRTCFKSVNVGELIVVGNHFDVGETDNSYRCLFIQNNSNLTFYDNLITGKNTLIENPNTLYFGQTIGNNGAKVVYCNAVPTTGKYGVGSICYNTEPAAGEPVGWICTKAGEGSAATWLSFATI